MFLRFACAIWVYSVVSFGSSQTWDTSIDSISWAEELYRTEHPNTALGMSRDIAEDPKFSIDVRLRALWLIYLISDYNHKEAIKHIATIMQKDGGLTIREVSEAFAQGFLKDMEREKAYPKRMNFNKNASS